MANIDELLAKVKELAMRGVDGEKENASALLKRLMKKYNLTETDLNEEKKDYCFFKYSDDLDCRLVSQIMYVVTSDDRRYTHKKKRKHIGCLCTASQRLEVETLHHFYGKWFKKDLETFYSAFLYKNNIFPATVESKEAESEEDKKRVDDIYRMMKGMNEHKPEKESDTKRIGYEPKMLEDSWTD